MCPKTRFSAIATSSNPDIPSAKRTIIRLFQAAILVAVGWGILHSLLEAREDLAVAQFRMADLQWNWVVVAAISYLLGLIPMGWYWHRLLRQMGQSAGLLESLRAYLIGHLGKYSPGKVMVIVIRTSLIRSQTVNATVVVVSVIMETMTMMASGAFLAGGCLLIWYPEQRQLQIVAIIMMIAMVVTTLPPVLRRLLPFLKPVSDAEYVRDSLGRSVTWTNIGVGWLACIVGWCLLGFSLYATLRAIPGVPPIPLTLASMARFVATVSLALVTGFVSLLPGGIGVREWVVDRMMTQEFGAAISLVAAILLRVVWLLTEVIVSAILYLSVGQRR